MGRCRKEKELTPKRKAFADEYLTDLNGTRAYKAVYKNVKNDATSSSSTSRLLKNVKVKAYIAERMKEIQNEKDSRPRRSDPVLFFRHAWRSKRPVRPRRYYIRPPVCRA